MGPAERISQHLEVGPQSLGQPPPTSSMPEAMPAQTGRLARDLGGTQPTAAIPEVQAQPRLSLKEVGPQGLDQQSQPPPTTGMPEARPTHTVRLPRHPGRLRQPPSKITPPSCFDQAEVEPGSGPCVPNLIYPGWESWFSKEVARYPGQNMVNLWRHVNCKRGCSSPYMFLHFPLTKSL